MTRFDERPAADRGAANDSARYGEPATDPRLAPLLADLEKRLRPILGDMPPALFDVTLRDIAAVKLRWMNEDARRGRSPAVALADVLGGDLPSW